MLSLELHVRVYDGDFMNSLFHEWPRSSSTDSDEELVQKAQKAPEGDLRAFEQLVLRYQRRVVGRV